MTTLASLEQQMKNQGVTSLFFKFLSPNDNSKNQPYLGGDYSALQMFSYGEVTKKSGGKRPNFKASLDFYWLDTETGEAFNAPNAKLILYPKYPEVRLSGFVQGCVRSDLGQPLVPRAEGRVLFLGTTGDGRTIAHVVEKDDPLAKEVDARQEEFATSGVFFFVFGYAATERERLLDRLREVSGKGWIKGWKLNPDGTAVPCNNRNCGGVTLESELGISPNSDSRPDFLGWEVKQYGVTNLAKFQSKPITLMTPQPTDGYYQEAGLVGFLKKYGYPSGKDPDRINFGGIHKYGKTTKRTELTLTLSGYDPDSGITDVDGSIMLVDPDDRCAAAWDFGSMLEHWNRKHNNAVYIQSELDEHKQGGKTVRKYRYGNIVRLGTGTDFLNFINAVYSSAVYLDPAYKMENASSSRPKTKVRSQFRISSKNLHQLYHNWEEVTL